MKYPILFYFLVLAIVLFGLSNCKSSRTLTTSTSVELWIDGNKYPCTDAAISYCNKVSFNGADRNPKWEIWDSKIEGLDIRPNNMYKLKVLKTEEIVKKTKELRNTDFQLIEIMEKRPFSREGRKNYDFIQKLWDKEVVFYVRGNEPGWMVDIYRDGTIIFNTMSRPELSFTTNKESVKISERARQQTYEFSSQKATMNLIGEKCEDSMSGEPFSHQVSFKIGDNTFLGCGMAVPDIRLNDIFVLEKLTGADGRDLDLNFEERPYIEFNIDQMKMFGFGGCNELGANINFDSDRIQLGPIMSSRRACPEYSEPELIQFMSNQSLEYQYNEMLLTLSNSKGTKAIWRKVD